MNGITGSTGAGQKLTKTSHFSWRNNNISVYKAFNHQHLQEIYQTINHFQPSFLNKVNFLPIRGNFSRGIFVTVYTNIDDNFDEIKNLYQTYYQSHPFTLVTEKDISLKDAVNTNKCLLKIESHDDKIMITSVIDNLIKGASGQAVQNMNIMLGLKETMGLKLKSIAF